MKGKRIVRKTLFSTLMTALLLGGIFPALATAAEAPKPIATVAFSGYDNLLKDVAFIGKLSDNPNLLKTVEAIVEAKTQGKGLAGIDKSRSWGLILLPGESFMPTGYAFIPVTNFDEFIGLLKTSGLDIADPVDGVVEIVAPNEQRLFVKQKGNWAYVCLSKDDFSKVADDPTKLLNDAAKKYNLSVRLFAQNIPAGLKEQAIAMMEIVAQAGMQKLPDEKDVDYAARLEMAKESIKQVRLMLDELDTIFVGLAVDETTGAAYFDLEETAVPNSSLAKKMQSIKNGKTQFGGFYQPKAALTCGTVIDISEFQQNNLQNNLKMYRSLMNLAIDEQELKDEEAAKAKKLVDDILAIGEKTIAAGKLDGGSALAIEPGKTTLIAGCRVVDSEAVDKLIQEMAKILAAEQPEVAKLLKLDAAEHNGVKFHTISLPVPENNNREKIVELIGEKLDLVLGVGQNQVYLGAGPLALDKLKAAIDDSKSKVGEEVAPLRMSLAATPICKFTGDVSENIMVKIMASSLASVLESSGDDDHITITVKPLPNGVGCRIELQKGILKVLGTLPTVGQEPNG